MQSEQANAIKPQSLQPAADGYASLRWYLWDGGFLLFGRSDGTVPPHAHHAIQIVMGMDGAMSILGKSGDWQSGHCIIVKPDTPHSFDSRDAFGAMLFVDPESREGLWLRSTLADPITIVPAARIAPCIAALKLFIEQPFAAMEIPELIRLCVHSLCTGAPPAGRLDQRVTRVLQQIRASDDLRIPLEALAQSVFLSPSRFAHLFKHQVGLPFRRYMLWRKLTRAMLATAQQGSIAAAAQAADFADAAHLTRTFRQMFGVLPSSLMRGKFFEIAPPFELH